MHTVKASRAAAPPRRRDKFPWRRAAQPKRPPRARPPRTRTSRRASACRPSTAVRRLCERSRCRRAPSGCRPLSCAIWFPPASSVRTPVKACGRRSRLSSRAFLRAAALAGAGRGAPGVRQGRTSRFCRRSMPLYCRCSTETPDGPALYLRAGPGQLLCARKVVASTETAPHANNASAHVSSVSHSSLRVSGVSSKADICPVARRSRPGVRRCCSHAHTQSRLASHLPALLVKVRSPLLRAFEQGGHHFSTTFETKKKDATLRTGSLSNLQLGQAA